MFYTFWKITVTQTRKSNNVNKITQKLYKLHTAQLLSTQKVTTDSRLKLMLKVSPILTDTPSQSLLSLIDSFINDAVINVRLFLTVFSRSFKWSTSPIRQR